MDIVVLGPEGMLGSAVVQAITRAGHQPRSMRRAELDLTSICAEFSQLFGQVVINCAGVTRHRIQRFPGHCLPGDVYQVNAVAPHCVAVYCQRLIQVSTDCVFNGKEAAPYVETSQVTPTDLYSVSKLAGEVTYGPHLTVRTSFIGFSPDGLGLLSWFLSQPPHTEVPGYSDLWSGYYVSQLATILVELAEDSTVTGLLHLRGHLGTKLRLLELLGQAMRPDLKVYRDMSRDERGIQLETGRKGACNDRHSVGFHQLVEQVERDLAIYG